MPMTGSAQRSLRERVERALILLAYFIELDGDVHVPLYMKFEGELGEMKKIEAAKKRSRKRLASYRGKAKPRYPELGIPSK